jgi:hypothetical protein
MPVLAKEGADEVGWTGGACDSWSSEAAAGGLTDAGRSRRGRRGNQSDHAYEVVRGRHQIASQLGPRQATVARASEATDCFHPGKDLLDALVDALADGIADVTRRTPVDGAAPPARVLCHVRRDLSLAQVSDAISGVIALVGRQCPRMKAALACLVDQLGAISRSAVPVAWLS